MKFNMKEIEEYEKIIKIPYYKWDNNIKLQFLNHQKLKELDDYVYTEGDQNFIYNQKLQEYLNMGFEVLYSNEDQPILTRNNAYLGDNEVKLLNEKIIYHRTYGIIGNVSKIEDDTGNIDLKTFNFYCEYMYLNPKDFPDFPYTTKGTELREFPEISIEEIKELINSGELICPWTKTKNNLQLTRSMCMNYGNINKIMTTFDDDIIDALGYEKKDGTVYVKK